MQTGRTHHTGLREMPMYSSKLANASVLASRTGHAVISSQIDPKLLLEVKSKLELILPIGNF